MMTSRNLKQTLVQLLQTHHLLNVSQLLRQLKTAGSDYNKTSVYRALEQLMEDNVVCRHYFMESEAFFELREHHHAHLVCTSCGNVESVPCHYQEPVDLHGFQPNHHHLTILGTCHTCLVR